MQTITTNIIDTIMTFIAIIYWAAAIVTLTVISALIWTTIKNSKQFTVGILYLKNSFEKMITYLRRLLGLCEHEWRREQKERVEGKERDIFPVVDMYLKTYYRCEKCGNIKIVKTK